MQKKKINIGLDIGITSVGWSIIEEKENKEFKILDLGVRLFDDVANPKDGTLKNAKRRNARSLRRIISRRKTRKEALKKLFIKYKLMNDEKEIDNLLENINLKKWNSEIPSQIKLEGINEKFKLDWTEKVIFCLYHYIHHRGYFWLTDDNIDNLEINTEKLPSEKICEFYSKNKYYKGSEVTNISANNWIKEIELFFKIQKLDENFKNEYINLFKTIRNFNEGPGSEKSPTPYGLYYIDEKTNEIKKKGDNLWDVTIGKCSFYLEELRGGQYSVISEVFNFLNDISNIYFYKDKTNRLNIEQKENLYKFINEKLNPIKNKKISFAINVKNILEGIFGKLESKSIFEHTFGLRTNKTGKIITECKNYIKLIKWVKEIGLYNYIDFFDIKFIKNLNEIFDIYFKYKDIEKRNLEIIKLLKEKYNFDNEINEFPKLEKTSKTHSLSYKAMEEYIVYSLKNPENTLNWAQYSLNESKEKTINIINRKYIPKGLFDDSIISPTARRAFNQTINVLNKIIEKYHNEYDIKHISIEVAREKNSKDKKQIIEKIQKFQENIKKEIVDNIEEISKKENISSAQILRYRLWQQQDFKDIYTGEFISESNVITGKDLDIDHIIPYSIYNDDSFNNKVLCFKRNNFNKLNKTPYQWLNSNENEYIKFKERVEKLSKINSRKKDLLLFEGDPMEIKNEFIAKNLVDTRYATILVMDTIKNFFNNNEFYKNNKPIVNVIRGSVTSYARNNIFSDINNEIYLKKDRKDFRHHAIDASIVAFLGSNHTIAKKSSFANMYNDFEELSKWTKKDNKLINNETGEVIEIDYFLQKNDPNVINFRKQLFYFNDKKNNDVKFSRLMITKNNFPITKKETIYSVKWDENKATGYKITKLNILEEKLDKLKKYFTDGTKEQESLICFQKDKILYNRLKTIFDQYSNNKINPFISFMEEHFSNEKIVEGENKDKKNIYKFLILDENTKIKSIKIKDDLIEANKVILLKKDKKAKNPSILQSLNMKETRIYKNQDNKYIPCPINIKFMSYYSKNKNLKVDENKVKEWMIKNNIIDNKFILFKNGTILVNNQSNKLFYSIGSFTNGKIEIKPLFKENEERNQISFTKIIKDYDICEIDILGKIYNRKEIKL